MEKAGPVQFVTPARRVRSRMSGLTRGGILPGCDVAQNLLVRMASPRLGRTGAFPDSGRGDRVRVLVVSHLFPTPTDPTSGIFVLEQMRGLRQRGVEVDIISPRPWAPRILSFWSRVRKHLGTSRHSIVDGFDVEYPRVPELPGARLLAIYGVFYYLQCRRLIRRRLGAKHYDLIHAHMVIPD